jgi:hypothetical protein
MQIEGLAGLSEQLSQLGEKSGSVASQGLYEGAGIMADEIKKGAENIQTAPFHYAVFITRQPSPEEKAAVLAAGVGIAKFDKNGAEVNTSIGYRNSGYTTINGKTKPIPQIVNAINSGTSFMQKQPFVRKAATTGAKKAEAAITRTIEQKFNEIIKK